MRPVQQPPHGGDGLLQQCQRTRRRGADLRHPFLHPVAHSGDQPLREHPGDGGELHREQHRVAERDRRDSDSHLHAAGGGECRGSRADRAGEAEILHHPQLIRPGGLRSPCEVHQSLRRKGTVVHRANTAATHAPIISMPALKVSDARLGCHLPPRRCWHGLMPVTSLLAAVWLCPNAA